MTIEDFKKEIKNWKFTRYKAINLMIGMAALLVYEFIGRPWYRPYIYSNKINDFHFADTLGNSLGTITTIFILIFLLSNEKVKGNYLIRLGTISVTLFEMGHPLLGKPIDFWDIAATIITGYICYVVFNYIFKNCNGTIEATQNKKHQIGKSFNN